MTKSYFWLFWAHFTHFWTKQNFIEKLGFASFYISQLSTIMQKIRKKKKHGRTDNGNFIRLSVYRDLVIEQPFRYHVD